MPTLCIEKGALVVVTGVNGLIGSHTADQLLRLGYAVRGVVRDVKKNEWLYQLFEERHPGSRFELVEVPDMTVEGCYDSSVQDAAGFIHIASPLGGFDHAPTAIKNGIDAALTALRSCAKIPSMKRFAWTSSSLAATNPHPNKEFSINETSYNEEAIAAVTEDPAIKGLSIYSAMKAQTERAMWKWMHENKPNFMLNTILPNANFGALLAPEQQGFPSTIAWARTAWTGDLFTEHATFILPQWFISPEDSALLHIAAILYEEVQSERLFGFAEPWNYNDMLGVFRTAYPDRKFPADVEGMGKDKMSVANERALEVLGWAKGKGWDTFDESVREMSAGWAKV